MENIGARYIVIRLSDGCCDTIKIMNERNWQIRAVYMIIIIIIITWW